MLENFELKQVANVQSEEIKLLKIEIFKFKKKMAMLEQAENDGKKQQVAWFEPKSKEDDKEELKRKL